VIMKLGWERFNGVFRSSKTKQTKPNE
jgi:hypothetical protein